MNHMTRSMLGIFNQPDAMKKRAEEVAALKNDRDRTDGVLNQHRLACDRCRGNTPRQIEAGLGCADGKALADEYFKADKALRRGY